MLSARQHVRRASGPMLYALVTVAALLRTSPGRVGIDTKQYLFLDPERLLGDATTMWQPGVAFGTVPHQNIGFLWPMGPVFWLGEHAGLPDWVTQRLWIATLLVAAGLGVRWLAHEFGITPAGAWVAGLVYAWGPFSLGYVHRTSVLLLPWAALGFLVVFAGRSVRKGGWRDPAAFALVAATAGGANATAFLLAGLAPALWVAHLALDDEIGPRRAARAGTRIALLTGVVSTWWFVALVVQGRYSLNILRYTETIDAVARSTSATEILRGLGYWLFYGRDRLDPWIEPAPAYQTSTVLLVASFALPMLGIVALLVVRSRYRGYCVSLLAVGVVVAIGAFPWDDPSPFGDAVKSLATSSDVGLALRSSTRAVPLVSLALALALGGLTSAIIRRARPIGLAGGGLVCVLALGAFPPLWQGTLVSDELSRPEDIPSWWSDAVRHVDADQRTRVLEVPGIDLTFHRWGATWEPITPGLTDRPFAARELVPYGAPGSVDMLRALDRRMQEGTIEPAAIAPIARLLGAGDLLVRSDLEYERFRTPRPRLLWDVIQRAPGLGTTTAFGAPTRNAAGPELPLIDEIELGTPNDAADPPPVAVVEVLDVPDIVHATAFDGAVIVAGSGDGLVEAAAAALLERPGTLFYSASIADEPALLDRLLDAGADLLVTDTNRRRAERWRTLRDNLGLTEASGEVPLVDDESDARLDLFPVADDDHRSVTVTTGARATATAYGNPITYTPSERPQLAVDGDPATAWTVGAFDDPRGERLLVDFDEPRAVATIEVVPAQTGGRRITELSVRADGRAIGTLRFPDASPQQVNVPSGVTVDVLEFEILDTDPRATAASPDAPAVGIAEIRIPEFETTERVRVPVDLVRRVDRDLEHRLVYLLARERSDPAEAVRDDDETQIARIIEVPSSRAFSMSGTARLAAAADDVTLWSIIGERGPVASASDSLPGDLASRPWAAIDGDPSTSWQTAFGDQTGRWIELALDEPTTADRLTIDVLADGRHSIPRTLTISTDEESRQVDLPSTDVEGPLTVRFPALSGDRFRVTIDNVEAIVTRDWYRLADIVMPIGITELTIPGAATAELRTDLSDECRDDLISIDGGGRGVRLTGTVDAALRRRALPITGCDGDVVTAPGSVTIDTTPGGSSGLDVDRLVLASAVGGTAEQGTLEPLGERSNDTDATVTVAESDDTRIRAVVDTAGRDTVLVLGQNHNDGWRASVGGRDLGRPTMVNGYANGWIVGAADEPLEVTLAWTPQQTVDQGLLVSLVGLILCLTVLVVAPTRSTLPASVSEQLASTTSSAASSRLTLPVAAVVGAAAGVATWATTGSAVAVVVALFIASCARWRRGTALLAVVTTAIFAGAFVAVVLGQRRNLWRADFDWPTHFVGAHQMAVVGLVLLVATVGVDHLRSRSGTIERPR